MIYIGIDPGKDGAYAWTDGEDYATYPMGMGAMVHDLSVLLATEAGLSKIVACVEKVGAMPKQGVTSTFNFGKSAGFIEGVLTALDIPFQLVTPKMWKSEYGLNSDKAKSVEVCKRLFPNVNLKRTERCKKDHDGMAEALLMAEYARRKWGRE